MDTVKKLEPLELAGRFSPPPNASLRPIAYQKSYREIFWDTRTPYELQLGIIERCGWQDTKLLCDIAAERSPVHDSHLRYQARTQLLRLLRNGAWRNGGWDYMFDHFAANQAHCPRGAQDREHVVVLVSHALFRRGGSSARSTVVGAARALFWMEQWAAIRKGRFVSLVPDLLNAYRSLLGYMPPTLPEMRWGDWALANNIHYEDGEGAYAELLPLHARKLSNASRRAFERDCQLVFSTCYETDPAGRYAEINFTLLYLTAYVQAKLKQKGLI